MAKKPMKDLPATNAEEVKGGMDGISRLVNVTAVKSQNANEDALGGADRQRDVVSSQKFKRT